MLELTLYINAYMCPFKNKLIYFLGGKKGFIGDDGVAYVNIKEHKVSLTEPTLTIEKYNALAVELLNEAKDKIQAETHIKVQAIEDKIQSFLALPAPVGSEQDDYEGDQESLEED